MRVRVRIPVGLYACGKTNTHALLNTNCVWGDYRAAQGRGDHVAAGEENNNKPEAELPTPSTACGS